MAKKVYRIINKGKSAPLNITPLNLFKVSDEEDLTPYVPYIGANRDINLGTQKLFVGLITSEVTIEDIAEAVNTVVVTKEYLSTITLQVATDNGRTTTNDITVVGYNKFLGIRNYENEYATAGFKTDADGLPSILLYSSASEQGAEIRQDLLTERWTYQFPDKGGIFALLGDITIPSLQAVTDVGNSTNNSIIAPSFVLDDDNRITKNEDLLEILATYGAKISGTAFELSLNAGNFTFIALGHNGAGFRTNVSTNEFILASNKAGVNAVLNFDAVDITRSYTLPNKSGTIALLDDIPEEVTIDESLQYYDNEGVNTLGSNISIFKDSFVWYPVDSTTFTMSFTPTNLLSVSINGLPLYSSSQYVIVLPNQIEIKQELLAGDTVDILYEHYIQVPT